LKHGRFISGIAMKREVSATHFLGFGRKPDRPADDQPAATALIVLFKAAGAELACGALFRPMQAERRAAMAAAGFKVGEVAVNVYQLTS
jgi:hypothetical protein